MTSDLRPRSPDAERGARRGPARLVVIAILTVLTVVTAAIAVAMLGRGPVLAAVPWVDATAECLTIAAAIGIAIVSTTSR
jgi:hypothetical protein